MKLRLSALVLACLAPLCAHAGASLTGPDPYVIPLESFPDSGRLGINVTIGSNPQPFTYLLDTGSAGFLTAMGNTSFWTGSDTTPNGDSFDIGYNSGNLDYRGDMATATLSFSNITGSTITVANATLGIITNATLNHAPYPNWDANINRNPPQPPESGTFYGTFGAGLFQGNASNGNVSSVIGQMAPAGLTQGFVIHTGGINSTTPTLTIGLNATIINSFPIIVKMNPSTGNYTASTGANVTLYPKEQVSANYTFSDGNPSDTFPMTGDTIMDTGGLNTTLQTGATISSNITDGSTILPGINFSGNIDGFSGNQGLDWSFLTGNTAFTNLISLDSSGHGTLNTGITLFYQYDVMFDTQDGLVGFRPTSVPEPSSYALIAGGACFVLATAWKMRRQMKRREAAPPAKDTRRRTAKR